MPQCLIPNCANDAIYYLGIRLRRPAEEGRPAGTAIWAPNCDAYLCAEHAAHGYVIDIRLTPTEERNITTNVSAADRVITRITPIANLP